MKINKKESGSKLIIAVLFNDIDELIHQLYRENK